MVLLKALIADNVPSDKQAATFGNLGAFVALGFIMGPIISGLILETNGGFYNLALLMMALTAASLGEFKANYGSNKPHSHGKIL